MTTTTSTTKTNGRWRHVRETMARREQAALANFFAWQAGDAPPDPEKTARSHAKAAKELRAGAPWLLWLVRAGEIDEEMLPMLLLLRKRWLDELRLTGTPETLMVDQALLAFYHQLRLNGLLAVAERASLHSLEEAPVPDAEAPSEENGLSQRRLILALAACQGMLIRNLRTLYGLRSQTHLAIQNALTRLAGDNLLSDEELQEILS
ncbi:MAG: hypothetical protein ACYDCO_04860 [Armatimonadota bacterium]